MTKQDVNKKTTKQLTGTGTYTNPLTFASAPGEFTSCEVIYVPYLKKYARFEDYCAQCGMSASSSLPKPHLRVP